jgi:hypothetical protein
MAKQNIQTKTIAGWGVDKDPKDRPAVPKEVPSNVVNVRGRVPERQVPYVKIHVSPEHPDITPVFGTTCPPKGLSGVLRNYAYKFSEGRIRHWMILLLADRVDVIEGLIQDLSRGYVPNILKERGLKSELTHASPQRKQRNLIAAAAAVGVLTVGVIAARKVAKNRALRRPSRTRPL